MKYSLGPFRLDSDNRVLLHDGAVVRVPPKAVDLLLCLVEHQGVVVPKEELFARVWPDTVVQESSLAQTVLALRRSLKEGFGEREVIETVPRRGYRLTVEATVEVAAGAAKPVSELVAPVAPADTPPSAPTPRQPHSAMPYRLIAVAALTVTALGGLWYSRQKALQKHFTIQPLTTAQEKEDDSSISADGKHVVYAWRRPGEAHYGLWLKTIGSTAPNRVSNSDGDDRRPVWAPDRPVIAFVRTKDGVSEIHVIAPAGDFIRTQNGESETLLLSLHKEHDRAIARVTSPDCDLAWSPDGKWLAFGDRANSNGVQMVNMETGQQRQLTSPLATFFDSQPRFSPDGKTLGFVRQSSAEKFSNVYSVPVEGGKLIQLTDVKRMVRGFDWTEDGQEIVYSSDIQGNVRLFRTEAHGEKETRWLEDAGYDTLYPSISRRGHRLTFTQGYVERSLFSAPGPGSAQFSEGDAAVRLGEKLKLPGLRRTSPAFSPDGTRIAFVSEANGSTEVWVANADGSRPLAVTRFTEGAAGSPSWSPDGRFLAYDRVHPSEGVTQIFIVPAGGGEPRQFTFDLTNHTAPTWSADGKWIYYSAVRSGAREIWRQGVSSGAVEQITHTTGVRVKPARDGQYVYYVNTTDSRIWRARAEGGSEELISEISRLANGANWALTSRGIYWEGWDATHKAFVFFFDFATRKNSIAAADGPEFLVGDAGGIAVSPDDKVMILARIGKSVQHIMVADDFR